MVPTNNLEYRTRHSALPLGEMPSEKPMMPPTHGIYDGKISFPNASIRQYEIIYDKNMNLDNAIRLSGWERNGSDFATDEDRKKYRESNDRIEREKTKEQRERENQKESDDYDRSINRSIYGPSWREGD